MRILRHILLTASSLVCLPAHAQQVQSIETVEQPPADGEIVVTAQRRAERLQDVPIAITAISSEKLQNANITNTRDLQRLTPGLTTNNQGYQFRPTIRAIGGFTGGGAGDEPNVAIYVDNVYYASPGANTFQLPSIERIEVLKGPQGTLFGRNATGGAIRIMTRDPSYDPSLNLSASFGARLNSQEYKGDGTLGISDKIAASFSGFFYDDQGYIRNIATGGKLGDTRSYLVRGKLLFEPLEQLRLVLGGDYGKSRSTQQLATTVFDSISSVKNVAGVILPTNDREVSLDTPGDQRAKTYTAFLNATLDLDKIIFTSTTAYRVANVNGLVDSDRSNLPIAANRFEFNQKQFSQEIVGTTHLDGPLQLVGGVFYFRTNSTAPAAMGIASPVTTVGSVRQVSGPAAVTSSIYGNVITKSWSAFGEATWDVDDHISFIGGLRFTRDAKDLTVRNNLAPASPATTASQSWNNVSYRATARYKFNADQMLYATASSGYKSGAFNAGSYTYPNPPQQAEPEKLSALEAGYKGSFFDRHLTVATSIFHYSYDNIQLSISNTTAGTAAGTQILTNAATAKVTGGEIEIGGRVDSHWSGQIGVSLLPQATYNSYPKGVGYRINGGNLGASLVTTDFSGRRMVQAPKSTVSASLNYETPLASGALSASAGYYRTSKIIWALLTTSAFEQKSYDLINATVGWTAPGERYRIDLWGTNLGNTHYATAGATSSTAFGLSIGAPREVGVRLSVKL